MRVISQDGTIDVPYERFVISVNMQNKGEIIACTGNHISDDECIVMAVYSSYAKAQKAMDMLRETYQYGKKIPVQKLDEYGIDKEDDITLYNTRLINDFFKGGTYVPVKVFQFPADEDVEVQDEQ